MKKSTKGEIFTEVVLEVFKLGGLLIDEGDQITKEFGITSARWKVLGAIALAEAPQTVPQIARTMGLTRQAVQRLVDAMNKESLLEFKSNPDHKKAKLVNLTVKGKEISSKLDKKQIKWAQDSANNLTKKDLDIALSVLKNISRQFGP